MKLIWPGKIENKRIIIYVEDDDFSSWDNNSLEFLVERLEYMNSQMASRTGLKKHRFWPKLRQVTITDEP